jgi:hypothetical protein
VGGNGILTYQATFFTQGTNPFRLIPDSSGNFLLALDHDAPSNALCSIPVPGQTSCGDVTVFSVNSTTGRLTLVTNAQQTSNLGTQITYFPVQANPIDFTLASSNLEVLAGAAGTPQTSYPYVYSSSTGQLTTSTGGLVSLHNGSGGLMEQGTAIINASGHVYILDNEVLTSGNPPGQILTFTVGSNGALNSLVGGAVADDPTETYPLYLIVESKGKYLYVANEAGAGINNGAGLVAYTIDPTSSQLTEDPGSPFPAGTGATPSCLLEDPSNQYIYTANAGDSTVTGNLLDPNSGVLRSMQGWSGSIGLTGPATYCFTTGRTN